MHLYVDVVKNDLRHGRQVLVARLVLEGEDLRIETRDERLRHALQESVMHPVSGGLIYPSKEPREYLEILHEVYGGSMIFATRPYTSPEESRFCRSETVPLAAAV
jgi:hypothetical protein